MRALIADDDVLLREGLARLLSGGGIEVVAQAGDADALLALVEQHRPDVAIVDVRMPPTGTDDGLRAAIEIRSRFASTAVLVLSQYVEERTALRLLRPSEGGVGYLLKDRVADVGAFREALGRVAGGGFVLDPEVSRRLLRPGGRLDALTARQRDVLALMAEGRSNQAIAGRLEISARAVQRHITSIFDRLGLAPAPEDHRRVLAVLIALERRP